MNKWDELLDEILEEFETLRIDYRSFVRKGDLSKSSLIEFEGRFVDLKAKSSPVIGFFTRKWTMYDDKAATAIKYRIANAIFNGEHPDFEQCSITQAEKFASSSKEYKEFIDKRAGYREAHTNMRSIKDDVNSYINEIKDRIKLLG